jgi:uncharacterized membrane protein
VYKNKAEITGLIAPVIINIETAKPYMSSYGIIAEPGKKSYGFTPTGAIQNELRNAVVYTEIPEIHGKLIQEIFVMCYGKEDAIKAIDNITVFIGNKTYYFPRSKIETWNQQKMEDGILFQLPVEPYAKSIIKPWINWYGDLNLAIKEISEFLVNPFSSLAFIIAAAAFLLLTALLWQETETKIAAIINKDSRKVEIIMLFALLVFAFLLRIDGLTRHSSWLDELYSSTIAANPNQPLLNAFNDPGNPPLFYLLLRLWHQVFGWSELSGRMLSVVIGIAGLVSLYCFVKSMCGRKYALLAALLLSISKTHIGYSNEIRAFILQMTLMPLVLLFFFRLLQKDDVKSYTLYILTGAALVNTHYFGVLLIAFNFFYYLVINRKQLSVKKTGVFIAANIIIALALLPFFVITAFQKALVDSSFNAWIPKPGKKEFAVFAVLLLTCLIFPLIKRHSKTVKSMTAQSNGLLDYAIYAGSFIFISAYLVSFKRPILTWRYLSICIPLLISIFPLAVCNTIRFGKFGAAIRFVFVIALMRFSVSFTLFGGANNDVYKEAQEYIVQDVVSHSLKAAELTSGDWDMSSYYGLAKIEPFSSEGDYDVIYPKFPEKYSIQNIPKLKNAAYFL